MDWTEQFFRYMGKTWDNMGLEQLGGDQAVSDPSVENIYERSLALYAAKEAAMWKRMEARASVAFSAARLKEGI